MRIKRLDEITINQIAAGEVVENSASVLKELVENSLDAGATHIQVELLAGGRQLLRVSDNGCGMAPEEVVAALERHATSKLRAVDDLNELLSFGFRGEAIPSIASISRCRLVSAQDGEDGFGVRLEAGQILEQGPAARERGTTVEVRDLFFNVPVRLKFQKSPSSDLTACTRTLKQLALAHPNVWFELRIANETVFEALPADETIEGLQQRCQGVLGADWKHARGMTLEEGQLRLKILLQPPQAHRPNRNDQFIMLNRRVVQCPSIGIAIRDAMAHRLDPGRYPAFLAAVDLPPSWVDVNVHPQKREVRLRQEAVLRGTLARATHCLLAQWTLEPHNATQAAERAESLLSAHVPGEAVWSAWQERSQERLCSEEQRPLPHSAGLLKTPDLAADAVPSSVAAVNGQGPDVARLPREGGREQEWEQGRGAEVCRSRPLARDTGLFSLPIELVRIGDYRLLMGVEEGFWQAQGPGLWLVDECALRRAFLQDLLGAKLEVQSQPLLLAEPLQVSAEECERLGCRAAGFDWREHEGQLILTAIPSFLESGEASDLLLEWLSCGGLGAGFWKRLARKRLRAVGFGELVAYQTRLRREQGPLGEPIRAWVSEMGLATYLSKHGSHESPLTSTKPALFS